MQGNTFCPSYSSVAIALCHNRRSSKEGSFSERSKSAEYQQRHVVEVDLLEE